MQARPTTEQILNDLAREIRDTLAFDWNRA